MAKLIVLYKTPTDASAFDKHYRAAHVAIVKKIPGLRAYELSKGAVAESTEWGATFRAAMTEACAVANASGASVNPAEPHELFDSMPPSMRSSMEKDLAAGRELELDAIAGPIVRGADRYGIDAATTTALAAVIRAKARRPPAAVAPRPARPVPVADP